MSTETPKSFTWIRSAQSLYIKLIFRIKMHVLSPKISCGFKFIDVVCQNYLELFSSDLVPDIPGFRILFLPL